MLISFATQLAQSEGAGGKGGFAGPSAMAGICILALIGLFIWARRWKKRLREYHPAEGFTLDELRQMRDRGEIDNVEFEALRNALITTLKSNRKPPPA